MPMFKSSANLRLAAEMRALQRVAAPWRKARSSWFDGTPESVEARLAATERVLTFAKAGVTPAHMALEREAATARAELREASHRLLVDFLDDGARAFKGSKRVAKERGLRECINCEGALSGEEGDDPDAECGTCGKSAHEKGVDWRKSNRTASDEYPLGPGYERPGFGHDDIADHDDHLRHHDYHTGEDPYHGKVWPHDFPLPEGTSPKWNDDGTLTCPNCGYDEVTPNTSSTCPECDHYHDDFIDDSDEAVGGFERAMERKYPILPEHGGPESGLWGGKWGFRGASRRTAGSDEDDYDEDTCSTEGCGESLDDGEGFDGYCGNCADKLESEGHWKHHDASRRTAGQEITDHEFKPYSDGPEYCVEELPSSGDTCNEHFSAHARVDPRDRQFLEQN